MDEEYTKHDVSRIIGESVRKIVYWTDIGLIVPDIEPSQGRGKKRVYSKRNLIEFSMIQVLKDKCSVPLQVISVILSGLRVGQHKSQKFRDFFESDEWGSGKELIFVLHSQAGPRGFYVVCKNKYGSYDLPRVAFESSIKNSLVFTVVMLGKVKVMATKKF